MAAFEVFITFLSSMEAAKSIMLANSNKNLRAELHSFANAWNDYSKFPEELKSYCSSLVNAVASNASDLDIWTAAGKLLVQYHRHITPTTPTHAIHRGLQRSWTNPYIADSLEVLKETVRNVETKPKSYYRKTIVVANSSGTGKSRLLDEYGQSCPMIN